MRERPAACKICGVEAVERRQCPRCGCFEWVIEHQGHWRREVVVCDCPGLHSASGKQMREAQARQAVRELTGKRLRGRPGKDHPVTTPEMARKAAHALAPGVPAARALREAGFPKSSCQHGLRGINRMVRAELKTLGRKYIDAGRDLSPEDQELVVRGMLFENVVLKTDKGVAAAKQLGADKKVAMWQPDSQVGMVVLQAPPIPKIDHPVEWIGTRAMKERRKKEEVEDDSR